ncbi:MAG TPA: 2OG-Fe(II) oxygenase [Hydrogenophaga sp.]|uniref:2OG-Fe(II) oxygenase n=1 Tax=Hydrogenophaga sp. TaxID=1904254 RepID=UPI002B950D0C|nr:2OG-Fe(II) oxygenase [Hydrogenophaga sp.]HMN93992.1 2OG-Fe(II) oxygenase [Hydrogenophaga sp.]HMP09388.1 2OG-Fe(II) oxygenase [Hydrogenophaga sp.]
MSQSITPELRQWIVEQARDGHSPESVLTAMQAAGWQADVAIRALEETLERHLRHQARALAPNPVPDLDLTGGPTCIDAGDRHVEVIATLGSPRVVVLGGLLSDDECDGLIQAARPRMARSLTVQTQTGGEELNPDRTSQGMFFQRGESELISRIEARIARLVQWPVDHGEGLQVLHYRPGAEYKPHYDYFDPEEPGTPTILKRGGQRVGTLVMYLNQPEQGGGTTFPDVGLEVAPVRGNAVFFSYDRPHPATRTLHGGAPVVRGEKWVATKWLRERIFN